MENEKYNNKKRIIKKVVKSIFLVVFLLSLTIGLAGCIDPFLAPKLIINNSSHNNDSTETSAQKAYADLYEFLEENYYKEINKEEAFYYQLTSLVDSLGDPYTQISFLAVSPGVSNSNITDYDEEHFEGLGVSFIYEDYAMKIESVMRNSPAEKAFIYPGDKIIGARVERRDIIFADQKMSQTEAVQYVKGIAGQQRVLIVKGLDDYTRVIQVTYERFPRPTVTSNKDDLTATYGYIKIHQFEEKTALVFEEHLNILEERLTPNQTLIIDLRDNPGGYLTTIVPIMKLFITSNYEKVIGIKAEKSGKVYYYGGGLAEKKPYNIKVLVNGETASASEMLAAALHYFGGYEVYGTNTFGKNVYQKTANIPISEQLILSLKYTEGYWFYGEGLIMDNETNPIPVTEVLPEGILLLEIPFYTKDVNVDEVNMGLAAAQKYLNFYYPLLNLREDGYMDTATKDAIMQFQQDKGLYPSGIYNLKTSQAMYTDYINKLEDHLYDNQIQALLAWSY